MRCQYCGREAQPGQVYCECGHPISLSNDGYGAPTQGFNNVPDYGNIMTPDGRDLASLQRKSGMGAGGKILVMLLVIIMIGVGGFFGYKFIKGGDPLDESTWEKVDKDSFSITIPKSFKESNNIIELSQGYDRLGFFKGDKAGVYIAKAEFTSDIKQAIQQIGVEGLKQTTIQAGNQQTINGYKVTVKERGDLLYMEYPVTRKNYIDSTDKLWIVDATLITKDRMYEIEAYCAESEKDKYMDAMLKWIDSFKAK